MSGDLRSVENHAGPQQLPTACLSMSHYGTNFDGSAVPMSAKMFWLVISFKSNTWD
jgi:hypothetical protein